MLEGPTGRALRGFDGLYDERYWRNTKADVMGLHTDSTDQVSDLS